MERFLELARERKLDRVAASYAVVAWIVVQGASIALPAFDVPAWALRWLIVLLAAGLPAALGIAWLLGREDREIARKPFDRRDMLVFGLAGAVVVLVVVQLIVGWSWYSSTATKRQAGFSPAQAASIAVLPFANLSGDPAKAYFSDGIADQLISELSRMPSVRVAARTSSFAFKQKSADIKTIARALNVKTVLEGSVREDGKRVRIAAELVNADDGFQIWSESYDRNLTDILSLQDEIARAITRALGERLLGKAVATPGPAAKRKISPDVYKLYLQGQYYLAQRTEQGIARAIALFTRVSKMAPDYAEGYAGLADARSVKALNFAMLNEVNAAAAAADKALALDPANATALVARARVSLLKWKWRSVAEDLRRLEKLHVNTATVWRTRAVFFDYMGLPQFTGAAEQKAVQLDPLSFIDHYNLALYALMAGRYDQAMKFTTDALALQPGNSEVVTLQCRIETERNRIAEAQRLQQRLAALAKPGAPPGDDVACRYYIAVADKNFKVVHKIADAAAAAFPASGISATDIGIGYARANDVDAAIAWFRRAFAVRDPQMLRVPYVEEDLTALFADPRWKALRDEPLVRDWEAARAEVAAEFQAGE